MLRLSSGARIQTRYSIHSWTDRAIHIRVRATEPLSLAWSAVAFSDDGELTKDSTTNGRNGPNVPDYVAADRE